MERSECNRFAVFSFPRRVSRIPILPECQDLSETRWNAPTNCQLAEVYLQLIEATIEWNERIYRTARITIADRSKNKRAYCRSLLRLRPLPPCSFSLTFFFVCVLHLVSFTTRFDNEPCLYLTRNASVVRAHRDEHQDETPYNIISPQCIYRTIPETMPIVQQVLVFARLVSYHRTWARICNWMNTLMLQSIAYNSPRMFSLQYEEQKYTTPQ